MPLFLMLYVFTINAQSPPILIEDIPFDTDTMTSVPDGSFGIVADIELGYNLARRFEESQFCLGVNTIANLVMPSQAEWDSYTSDEKVLFLINDERIARAGLDYCNGEGPVSGVPFTGVEINIDNIAQIHADSLIASQSTTLQSQATEIDQDANIGGTGCVNFKGVLDNCCHTFIPRSVSGFSIANNSNPPNPDTVTTVGFEALGVYFLIYGNGSSTAREAPLLQDIELGGMATSPCGYTNDYGSVNDEGFIGVGIGSGVPNPTTNRTHVDILVITYFDPISQDFGCNYNCITCDNCPVDLVEDSVPILPGVYEASNSLESAGAVQLNTVEMIAGNFIQLNSNFEVIQGAVYHARIDNCFFSLN